MVNANKIDYRFSKYNYKIITEENEYLFNSITGALGKLNKETRELISSFSIDEGICNKEIFNNEDFYNKLKEGKFIIPKELEELDYLHAAHYANRFGNTNFFGLTIAPTLGCNFRCSYCFEQNNNYPTIRMDDEIASKVVELVEKRCVENGMLSISWFGGEPLLEMERIISMQSAFNEIVARKHASLSAGIVTNGYLLTKENSDKLVELGIKFVQITLDGCESVHNKRRPLVNGKGTFEKIVDNILNANEKLTISVRVNIDKENSVMVEEFLESLNKIGLHNKKNVSLYFSLVRDSGAGCQSATHTCYSVGDYANEEPKLYKLALDKDFKVSKIPRPLISNCGAVSPNVLLVEPDGTLQKCWNAIGDVDKAVGHLVNKSDRYTANELKWLSWDKFKNPKCTQCKELPLCMGGCPYISLYEESNDRYHNCNPGALNINETLELVAKQSESINR